jgi:hypothetical protein
VRTLVPACRSLMFPECVHSERAFASPMLLIWVCTTSIFCFVRSFEYQ